MPQLPSGRYVDIMAERARYHARRLSLRISANTPHLQLYPLIDILIDPTNNDHGCRGCASFSGYTLADRQWINDWPEGDRRFFIDWLHEDSQVRRIEHARKRLLVERATPKERRYDYPRALYSELQHRLQGLSMGRASVRQWRRTLLNMRKDGIRREELDWSRLPDFLSHYSDEQIITREQLLEAIDFSAIAPRLSNELDSEQGCRLSFDEVAQRLPGYQLQMAGYPLRDDDVAVLRYRNPKHGYRVGNIRPQGRSLRGAHEPRWFALGPYGKVISDQPSGRIFFPTAEDAREASDVHAKASHRLRPEFRYSNTYEYMSLMGGDEYREWLVTLPDYQRSHFSAHYYERNVLLHIRSKLRVTEGGTRVLFIEEIQSDWHQAVSRYGLHSGIAVAPFRKEWVGLALKLMIMHAIKEGLDGIAWADAQVHQMRYDRSLSALQHLYDHEVPRVLNRLGRDWGAKVAVDAFKTRSPWLHASRCNECWKVEGGEGKFSTRPRYDKKEALALIERHSKATTLDLPIFRLPAAMKEHILNHGLPLFGERLKHDG